MRERLFELTENAVEEFQTAWPKRSVSSGVALIAELTKILEDATIACAETSVSHLPVEHVTKQIANCITTHRYVVFHHRETTRRDGGFYGNG